MLKKFNAKKIEEIPIELLDDILGWFENEVLFGSILTLSEKKSSICHISYGAQLKNTGQISFSAKSLCGNIVSMICESTQEGHTTIPFWQDVNIEPENFVPHDGNKKICKLCSNKYDDIVMAYLSQQT